MKNALFPLMTALALAAPQAVAASRPAARNAATLESVRVEIGSIEKELLASRESQLSAAGQLRKIRKLLQLQQKEIQLSKKRIGELSTSLSDLSAQKGALLANIDRQKISLRSRLRELWKLTETDKLDAAWLADIDGQAQKTYFLERNLRKELAAVTRLREDVAQAQNLELRILEEKNKVDYYVQELGSQTAMLSANEDVQKEIIRTNRSSRLEALTRIKGLKDSERELESMLASLRRDQAAPARTSAVQKPVPALATTAAAPAPAIELALSALKGRLPLPVEGRVASLFGRSYNSKTNLLTFQKGITLSAQPGAHVRAVSAGKVVFAGPLHNYGLIAIVEHPGQYYTLYGQMGAVAVKEGTHVQQGDTLGQTDGEPLYFEIRNKNVAINPSQWFAEASTKLTKQ